MCVCLCVRACETRIGHLPVEVLHFTNDLTMPPGAVAALLAPFVCLFVSWCGAWKDLKLLQVSDPPPFKNGRKITFPIANIYTSITFNKLIVTRADGCFSCGRWNEAIVERREEDLVRFTVGSGGRTRKLLLFSSEILRAADVLF